MQGPVAARFDGRRAKTIARAIFITDNYQQEQKKATLRLAHAKDFRRSNATNHLQLAVAIAALGSCGKYVNSCQSYPITNNNSPQGGVGNLLSLAPRFWARAGNLPVNIVVICDTRTSHPKLWATGSLAMKTELNGNEDSDRFETNRALQNFMSVLQRFNPLFGSSNILHSRDKHPSQSTHLSCNVRRAYRSSQPAFIGFLTASTSLSTHVARFPKAWLLFQYFSLCFAWPPRCVRTVSNSLIS